MPQVMERHYLRQLLTRLQDPGPLERDVWLAMVEDAIRAALPADSKLLKDYERKRQRAEATPSGVPDDGWVHDILQAALLSIDATPPSVSSDEMDGYISAAITRQYFKSWPFYLALVLIGLALSLYGVQISELMGDAQEVGKLRNEAIASANEAAKSVIEAQRTTDDAKRQVAAAEADTRKALEDETKAAITRLLDAISTEAFKTSVVTKIDDSVETEIDHMALLVDSGSKEIAGIIDKFSAAPTASIGGTKADADIGYFSGRFAYRDAIALLNLMLTVLALLVLFFAWRSGARSASP
jgi:hypothetical protein